MGVAGRKINALLRARYSPWSKSTPTNGFDSTTQVLPIRLAGWLRDPGSGNEVGPGGGLDAGELPDLSKAKDAIEAVE